MNATTSNKSLSNAWTHALGCLEEYDANAGGASPSPSPSSSSSTRKQKVNHGQFLEEEAPTNNSETSALSSSLPPVDEDALGRSASSSSSSSSSASASSSPSSLPTCATSTSTCTSTINGTALWCDQEVTAMTSTNPRKSSNSNSNSSNAWAHALDCLEGCGEEDNKYNGPSASSSKEEMNHHNLLGGDIKYKCEEAQQQQQQQQQQPPLLTTSSPLPNNTGTPTLYGDLLDDPQLLEGINLEAKFADYNTAPDDASTPASSFSRMETENQPNDDGNSDSDSDSDDDEDDTELASSLPTPTNPTSSSLPTASELYEELLDKLEKPLKGRKEASMLVAGAQLGLFYETLAMMAAATRNKSSQTTKTISFFDSQDKPQNSKKHLVTEYKSYTSLLQNLSAFMYWDYAFNSFWKLRDTKTAFRKYTFAKKRNKKTTFSQWTNSLETEHKNWCKSAGIAPAVVKEVSDIFEECIHIIFQVRYASMAEWLQCNTPFPLWKRTRWWRGTRQERETIGRDTMLNCVYGTDDAARLCDALCALCESGGDTHTAMMYALEVTGEEWKPCSVATKEDQTMKTPNIVQKIKNTRIVNKVGTTASRVKNTKIGNKVGTAARKVQNWKKNRRERRESKQDAMKGQPSGTNEFQFDLAEDDFGCEEYDDEDHDPNNCPHFHAIAPVLYSLRVGEGGDAISWCSEHASEMMVIGNDLDWMDRLFERGNPPHVVATRHQEYQPPQAFGVSGRRGLRRPKEVFIYKDVWPAEVHWDPKIKVLAQRGEVKYVSWKVPHNLRDGKEGILKVLLSISSLVDEALDLDSGFMLIETICLGMSLSNDGFSKWSVLLSAHLSGWNLVGWSLFDDSCSNSKHDNTVNQQQHFYVFEYNVGYLPYASLTS